MDILNIWGFIFVLFFEFALVYINWEARAKRNALEMNPLWRKFDKRGRTLLSLVITPLIVVLLGSFALLFNLSLVIGVLLGALIFNLFNDYVVLQKMILCEHCKYSKDCSKTQNRCRSRIDKHGVGQKASSFFLWLSILTALTSSAGFIGYLLFSYLNLYLRT